jgi:hypothetical protein
VFNTILGQSIITGILIVIFLIFLYIFAASHEKQKRTDRRNFQSNLTFTQDLTDLKSQPKRLFKKDPQDPLLTFVYWVILPLFCAFVSVMLVLLAKNLF